MLPLMRLNWSLDVASHKLELPTWHYFSYVESFRVMLNIICWILPLKLYLSYVETIALSLLSYVETLAWPYFSYIAAWRLKLFLIHCSFELDFTYLRSTLIISQYRLRLNVTSDPLKIVLRRVFLSQELFKHA